jgi:hypothetical protein
MLHCQLEKIDTFEPDESMSNIKNRYLLIPLLLACQFTCNVYAGPSDDEVTDNRARDNVLVFIDHKNCAGAVKALNAGIAEGDKAILLLAAAMYEDGLCLKQDWPRAAAMYQRAHEAGNKAAIPRLVAGYALPGREQASAIWWAAQSGRTMINSCTPSANPLTETDAFVDEMSKWSKNHMDACTYTLGVAFSILGDMEFPVDVASFGNSGIIGMRFEPAKGTVEWKKLEDTSPGLIAGGTSNDIVEARSKKNKNRLIDYSSEVGQAALKRYPRPANIPSDWVVERTHIFTVEYQLKRL